MLNLVRHCTTRALKHKRGRRQLCSKADFNASAHSRESLVEAAVKRVDREIELGSRKVFSGPAEPAVNRAFYADRDPSVPQIPTTNALLHLYTNQTSGDLYVGGIESQKCFVANPNAEKKPAPKFEILTKDEYLAHLRQINEGDLRITVTLDGFLVARIFRHGIICPPIKPLL